MNMNRTPFLLRDRVEILDRDPASDALLWREGFVVGRTLEAEPRYTVRGDWGMIVDAPHDTVRDAVRPVQTRERINADQ